MYFAFAPELSEKLNQKLGKRKNSFVAKVIKLAKKENILLTYEKKGFFASNNAPVTRSRFEEYLWEALQDCCNLQDAKEIFVFLEMNKHYITVV